MSLSNHIDITNPATRFLEWKSDLKAFRWWDKQNEQEQIEKLPFTFIVLDSLACVRGFSDEHKSGIWSNEVRNLKTEPLTVRTKQGILCQGFYEHLKGNHGIRYTRSLYIAFREGKELAIGNLQLQGAANSAWIEFTKKNRIYRHGITVTGAVEDKVGKIVFNSPVFEITPIKEDTVAQAIELDKDLQVYLDQYFKNKGTVEFVVDAEPSYVTDAQDAQEAISAFTGVPGPDENDDIAW